MRMPIFADLVCDIQKRGEGGWDWNWKRDEGRMDRWMVSSIPSAYYYLYDIAGS